MSNFSYKKRVVDTVLLNYLQCFKSIQIVGPKWCGKTSTAQHHCNSSIYFQDYIDKQELKTLIKNFPKTILDGKNPKLIDEWQDAPEIWDLVRNECDRQTSFGLYIITGSSSKQVQTSHTGTGRICELNMFPMSLYESNESNGEISLKKLFENKITSNAWKTELSFLDLIFACCRGGWPETLLIKNKKLAITKAFDYFKQIYTRDMFNIDDRRRKTTTMENVLKSYARNVATEAKNTTLQADLENIEIDKLTLIDYLDVLKRLYVINEIPCWSTNIRPSSWIKQAKKRVFVDPSLAVAALGLSIDSLSKDLTTLGLIFENLCMRDLLVYSTPLNGKLSYYHDKLGVEIDCIITTDEGKIGLVEIKLGSAYYEDAAKHLNKVEQLICRYNKENPKKQIPKPSFKMIITAEQIGYKRDDGIYIVPIGCLKD